jgi:hypothetical protein
MSDTARTLRAAYVQSAPARRAANAAGRNYWSAYVEEICDGLGLTAQAIEPADLTPGTLSAISTLILPRPSGDWLSASGCANLAAWVRAGGLLVGLGVEGLDELFGVEGLGEGLEQDDDYSCAGQLTYEAHPLTAGAVWPLHPEAPGPLLAPIRLVKAQESERLAEVRDRAGHPTGCAAITHRRLGDGAGLYFAFDLAQHMWVAHQGRPIDADYDGDGYYRLSDAMPARAFEPELPYADQLLFLLRDVIAQTGQPLLSPLSPLPGTGQPADALFFWGGDDEAAEGTQVWASNWMREAGLPYHLNLMPLKDGSFTVSRAEFEGIKANGHEPSLHYDFQTDFPHPYAFTEAEVLQQAQWYEDAFGERAACSVFHWCHWVGWAEPAEWMLRAGGCADNSRIHRSSPPLNPVNLLGYAFGTSFPFHFYRDWRGGNERLPFLSEPITAYECGYDGASDTTDFTQLHRGLEMAVTYHLTTDLFFHPINVFRYVSCREAILEVLRWLEERGVVARHMGNDELARWWFARSQATLTDTTVARDATTFTVTCDWPDGCVVQVPCRGEPAGVDPPGVCEYRVRTEPWGRWLDVSCPAGTHQVTVRWDRTG